jgi:hypothetical protein
MRLLDICLSVTVALLDYTLFSSFSSNTTTDSFHASVSLSNNCGSTNDYYVGLPQALIPKIPYVDQSACLRSLLKAIMLLPTPVRYDGSLTESLSPIRLVFKHACSNKHVYLITSTCNPHDCVVLPEL